MISSVLPFFPFSGADSQGATAAAPAAAEPVSQPVTAVEEQGSGALHGRKSGGFLKSAGHMIKDALSDFRHAARDAFAELGLDGKSVNSMVKALIDPIRDELKSGADFVAQLSFATVMEEHMVGAGGSSGRFNLVAQSLTMEVNHSTGSVSIGVEKLEIQAAYAIGNQASGGVAPGVIDTTDDAPVAFPDLGAEIARILEGGEQPIEAPVADDAAAAQD